MIKLIALLLRNIIMNNSTTRVTLIFLALGFLAGCAFKPSIPEEALAESVPTFVLERDLLGKTKATGSFSAIDGTFREFVAYVDGSWDGEKMTLVEDFEYADGVKERKTWVLTKLDNGEYSGTREDVIGTARGYQDGKAFRLDYTMALPDDDGNPGRKLSFRDVIANKPDGGISNKAIVGIWGLRVATVDLTFDRE